MNNFTKYKIRYSLALILTIFTYSTNATQWNFESRTSLKVAMAQKMLTLNFKNQPISLILKSIQQQTKIDFVIDENIRNRFSSVTINVTDVSVETALDMILKNSGYTYKIANNLVTFIKIPARDESLRSSKMTISGKVLDANNLPIIGAAIEITGTNIGTTSDINGLYTLKNVSDTATMRVSYLGYIPSVRKVTRGVEVMDFKLAEDAIKVDDIIVSGYFQKTKQSYTGSEVQVKGAELRKVGSLNLIQAISVFDPSVRSIPNAQYGSDPNRVPEITVRGENGFDLRGSADDARSNPNGPMYLLDGLEVSPTRIYDLDMNRIESFTILKDASATSQYGSRGANGVIVIQTVSPREGEIKLSFNANYNVSVPDLRDYNLMNASEKLEYELLAGEYTRKVGTTLTQTELNMMYNEKLKEIIRGVDTYWLSKPLRTSLNQRYSAYIEGGDGSFRYGVDLKYDTDKGVMKGSGRDKIGGTINLNYNVKKKFYIINDLTVNDVTANNSPYGDFAEYARQNPYERTHDPLTGELIRRFAYNNQVNPLINAMLPNKDMNRYTEIQDNLSLDWRPNNHFRINGRLGITKKLSKNEIFRSPNSSEFDTEVDVNKKGNYTTFNRSDLNMDGNLTFAYNNTFKNGITLNMGVGSNLTTVNSIGDGYTATGYLNDNMNFPQYAQGFKENSTPTGLSDRSKMIGFFSNVNVGYDNRYFIDGSFRTDGNSRFGRDSRFAPFWSLGGAWNINRESWWNGDGTMKLRASAGSAGSVDFSADQAITQYKYNAENEYNGTYGALLMGFGNSKLKWQNTLQYNVGLDMTILHNLVTLNIDAYIKTTQNLLLPIDVTPSSGFAKYTENMGKMENRGFDLRLRFNIINDHKRDINWSLTLATSHNTNKITDLSNALESMNAEANKLENTQGIQPLRVYQQGRSQSALMVVRSLGIDAMTGNEIFVKLNGDLTFTYDPKDKIVIGDTNPKFQGNLQSNLTLKGFNLFFVLGYEFGAKIYNSTLASKVEGSDPKYNADKRVLTDRWKEPGKSAIFRRIDDKSKPFQSSRLVQKNDFVRLQSLSLSYDVPSRLLKDSFVERCKIIFTTNDLFRISTVKVERGTAYPFAQTFSLGANLTF